MCTGLTLRTKDNLHFFGRNLDVPQTYGQSVKIVPRGYKWMNQAELKEEVSTYGVIGMGLVMNNHPLIFDGVNEKGLAGAGLNFTRYAAFSETCIDKKTNVSASDFLYWVLSSFDCLADLKVALKDVVLTQTEVLRGLEVAKLHWIITDLSGASIVVEYMEGGMHVYDNPVGVLSNDPTFPWHLTNLCHYVTLTADSPRTTQMVDLEVTPFGHGTGRFGIPGDGTPAARFVRAVYYKDTVAVASGEVDGISSLLEVLDNVSITKGAEVGPNEEMNHTVYQSAMCQESGTYYYTDYNNRRLNAVSLKNADLDAKEITSFKYCNEQDINLQN